MDRKIHILCEDTKVNPVEFCYKYDATTKEQTERNYYKFSFKNLTYESSMPKRIEVSEDVVWHDASDGSQRYCLNDDEYSDFFDDEHNDYFDEDYEDDMEFLEDDDDDDETEMLNELDC